MFGGSGSNRSLGVLWVSGRERAQISEEAKTGCEARVSFRRSLMVANGVADSEVADPWLLFLSQGKAIVMDHVW